MKRSRKHRTKSTRKSAAPVSSPSPIVKKTSKSPMESESQTWARVKDILTHRVIPPIFILFFTPAVQVLAYQANPAIPFFQLDRLLGNAFSWKVVAIFLCWALSFLLIPSRAFDGPPTEFGYVPVYVDNGMKYYIASLVTYLGLHYVYPNLSIDIYDNMPFILASLNVFALILCTILHIMGIKRPQTSEKMKRSSLMYEFYRGMEIHPRLMGVDVKQWTNCRVGLMGWQVLILAFFIAGLRQGFNPGHFANVFLQTIYIGKFFWWETGYFNTLDITLDRAGYYICWGCLVWVPGFYTYSSFYLVEHQSTITSKTAIFDVLLGLIAIGLNYKIDYEKESFRKSKGTCKIWGKPAEFIKCVNQVTKQPSNLLLSGFWGKGRHLNYSFELLLTLAWSFPGCGQGIWPFLYLIFLTGLLVHRCYRDEEKCSKKYGRFWDEYCKKVPYRMIPYLY